MYFLKGKRMINRKKFHKVLFLLIIISVIFIGYIFRYKNDGRIIKIGIVYSDMYSKKEIKTIMDLAQSDIQKDYNSIKTNYKIDFYYYKYSISDDSESILNNIKNNDIKLVIGFDFSYQIKQLFNEIENSDIIIINPYSSSDNLCIKKNHIFRLKSWDSIQGKVIYRFLKEKDINAVIITNLNSTWQNNIVNTLLESMKNDNILVKKIIYQNVDDDIINKIDDAIYNISNSNVCMENISIINIGIFDTIEMIQKLDNDSPANNIMWIGSDALVSKSVIESDKENIISMFSKIPVICVSQTPINSIKYNLINEKYYKKIGCNIDFIQAARYDACYILFRSMYEIESQEINDIVKNIRKISKEYYGLTGNCSFNNLNDRIYSNYSIYTYDKSSNELIIIGNYLITN